ncbi:SCP2 sterol-binding domain-containing protein [Chloroflexi bacterium TSY]|nr:SCP2 sterol-binding domain-containing protein [Chloroflexi bacterium TSY]
MAIFHNADQFYQIARAVFEHIAQKPENLETFTSSNLVIRIILTDPVAEILIDGRQPPMEVFYGSRPGKANLEIKMTADLLHAIWLGHESAQKAFFSGRMETKGNLFKASSLIDLFQECEQVYSEIARQNSLL